MIPEYDVVVVDEAHELTARVTQAATDELSVSDVERAARRAAALRRGRPGRRPRRRRRSARGRDRRDRHRAGSTACRRTVADALVLVRDAARACLGACPRRATPTRTPAAPGPGRVQEVFDHAERMAANLTTDVLWLDDRERARGGRAALRRAAAGVGARCATGCSPTRPWCSPARP